jgi:hypothetical protein
MEKSEVQKALERFRDHVVSISKRNLTNKQKNSSKKLYNSIKGKVKANPNSFELEFSMEDYGVYVDAGVKGANPSKVSKNAKIRGQQAPNSKYRFGSGKVKNYGKFIGSLEQWIKRKGFRLRDSKGKFQKGSYKTLAHVLARNIYNRGIAPSMFFTKPFEAAYKNLPEELIDKYGLDAIELFNEQIDEIIRKNG